MKDLLFTLILTTVLSSPALASKDAIVCKTADKSKQVTLVRQTHRHFDAEIIIRAAGKTPIVINSQVVAAGRDSGRVVLDPARGKPESPWMLTVTNGLSKVYLSLRFPLYSDLYDQAKKYELGPNTFFYCDIEDADELLSK